MTGGRDDQGPLARRKAGTAAVLTLAVAGMLGLSFAAVPLYRLFCQVTGFGGTTQVAAAAPGALGARQLTVRFDANVDDDLPWSFAPVERAFRIRPGEPGLATYRASNQSHALTVGSATYNVTPLKAGVYFTKVACFCFDAQRLAPGESAELPVSFFVDPAILDDPDLADVNTITLSYTFFRRPDLEARARLAAVRDPEADARGDRR